MNSRTIPSFASLPSQGAWIEIELEVYTFEHSARSLPSQGAWIEMLNQVKANLAIACRSLLRERGLKFGTDTATVTAALVAPFSGSVD